MKPAKPEDLLVALPTAGSLAPYGWDFFAGARYAVDVRRGKAGPGAVLQLPGGTPATGADAMAGAIGPEAMRGANVNATIPDRYQIGPGDTLALRYWSPTIDPIDVPLRVAQNGVIALPTNDLLVVRGQTLAQAERAVQKLMAPKVKDLQLVLTMRELRTFSITVAGDAYAPGAYEVPSVATLYNVLNACGGPQITASFRDIRVKRGLQTLHFDLYRFLIDGDSSRDTPMEPGDVVFFPQSGTRLIVRGEVFRQGTYELKDGERLRDVIRFAGGVRPSGVVQRISVESIRPGQTRTMIDVDLLNKDDKNNPSLFDGDTVDVLSIRPVISNLVTIKGAVDQPGRYALWADKNMRVADLVERARGLLADVYLKRADLVRINPDQSQSLLQVDLDGAMKRDPIANVPLQPLDTLTIYFMKDVQWMGFRSVTISGAVGKPGSVYRADNLRVQDLLLQAGGLLPTASPGNAFLQRVNDDDSYGPLIKLDLRKAASGDPQHNILLQDRDALTVPSVREIEFRGDRMFEVIGAVQKPGKFPRGQGIKIADALLLAGNLLPAAYPERAFLQRRNLDETFGPLEIVNLSKALAGDPKHNLSIEDRDVLTVYTAAQAEFQPKDMVSIAGAVQAPASVELSDGMTLSKLVQLAGGLLPTAHLERAFLQRKNDDGTIGPLVRVDLRKVLSGDASADIKLKGADTLTVYTESQVRFRPEEIVTISGSVQQPGSFPSAPGMRLGDLIALAGGPLPEAFDEVQIGHALQPDGAKLDMASLAGAVSGSSADNPVLTPGDIVTVRARRDMLARPLSVTLSGAVTHPGVYLVTSRKTRLSEVVKLAGGLTSDAYSDGAQYVRRATAFTSPMQETLTGRVQKLLELVNEKEFARAAAVADLERVRLSSQTKSDSQPPTMSLTGATAGAAQQPQADLGMLFRHDTVSPARPLSSDDLRVLGNLNLQLDFAVRNPGSVQDIIVQDGDVLAIPEVPTSVAVTGAVVVPSAVVFVPGRTLDYYLRTAGGLSADAARDRTMLIHASGRVDHTRSNVVIRPGDIILVPTKIMAQKLTDRKSEIDNVLRYITNGLISFAIIRAVVK